MARIAVVLFNLGGPDRTESIKPFLFNLFNDSAIISLPQPIRWCLAKFISWRRTRTAIKIYAQLGGRSPLVELTEAQADALQMELNDLGVVEVFVCMRYWHPMSAEIVEKVMHFAPDHIVLMPLYPQYSTTTTGSSLQEWKKASEKAKLIVSTSAVCCYPTEDGWIKAQVQVLEKSLEKVSKDRKPRVLFSAHGLPKHIIKSGDPYQWQVEQTAAAIVKQLGIQKLDWAICYQSRVGPLEWIGPSIDAELTRAAADNVAVVIVPVAFVSEHSETLVELDIEYRREASRLGVAEYIRVPTVGTETAFIEGLGGQVRQAVAHVGGLSCGEGLGARICPSDCQRCPL